MLKVLVKREFSNNDSVFGLPNVNVVINDECKHVNTHNETATVNFMLGENVDEYYVEYEICNFCKAYRELGSQDWDYPNER